MDSGSCSKITPCVASVVVVVVVVVAIVQMVSDPLSLHTQTAPLIELTGNPCYET